MEKKLQELQFFRYIRLQTKPTQRKLNRPFFRLSMYAFLILSVFISSSVKAQDHILAWANSVVGGSGDNLDEAKAIAMDASGNVITTGLFRVTADFDPGADEFALTSAGGADMFVQKLDVNGNLLWAKRIGGASDEIGRAVATDAVGNVYVSGPFKGTVDFDPGSSVYELTAKGDNDVFVIKLAANGDFQWAKSIGNSGNDDAKAIATDASGNVYITGHFAGTVEFDPNHDPMSATTTELSSVGSVDVFVLKLSGDGNFGWAKRMGDSGSDIAYGIAVDGSGNIYTTGNFNGTVQFDPNYTSSTDPTSTQLTSSGGNDIFIQKLASDGSFLWVKKMGGTGSDIGFGIITDGLGNVYLTGQFNETVEFDPNYISSGVPSTTELTSAGSNDVFVQKLTSGGTLVWAKSMGGAKSDVANGIALDALGNVYTTGAFNGTADFDPGSETFSLTALKTNSDVFVSKLDANGNFVWAKGIYDSLTGGGFGIAVDAANNVGVTGSFGGTVDFDPGEGTVNLVSSGTSRDIFVMKFKPEGVTPVTLTSFMAKTEGNRAKLSWKTLSEQNNSHFAIYRRTDEDEFMLLGEVAGAGTSMEVKNYVFYDSQPQQGTNYYRLVQVDKNGKETIEGDKYLTFSLSEAGVRVYPNPTQEKIIVQFERDRYTRLSMVDLNGREISNLQIHQDESAIEMDITLYPAGIYLLKLTGSQSTILKVVKQ